MLGLLLYPGTLESYGTVCILPLLVLWSRRDGLPFGAAGVASLAGGVVALQGPLHAGFAANALLFACCALALQALDGRRPRTQRSEAASLRFGT